MSERDEQVRRIAEGFPGPRGPKGETGARGVRGLPTGLLSSFVILAVIILGLVFCGYYVLQRDANRIAATERAIARAAQTDKQQRCVSIAQIVAIPVPVPTVDNPSRETWAKFSLIQRHRGKQLGCKLPPPKYAPAGG